MAVEIDPQRAAYKDPALAVLGLSESAFLPVRVTTALATLERLADIDSQGTAVWVAAYTTALRGIAAARRTARPTGLSKSEAVEFNALWAAEYLEAATPGSDQGNAL